ncbi:STAS domain-containing protein [Streptomyces sp. NRRL F-2664]|uniref:STAS domain-containing protein n=1 Tax=Streptomyces sp. NRRL F-2664 TaxID=1463842 RepID=UPI0004CB2DFE|nr:STAS domain-containing protein [Streptomyces sp. NRRL F-2664]
MADDQDERGPEMESGDGHVVVRIGGEMDVDRAPMLKQALLDAVSGPDRPAGVILDLTDLTFCDSSGLNAILQARRVALEHGRQLRLHAPSPQVRRLLSLTGAESLFPITGT